MSALLLVLLIAIALIVIGNIFRSVNPKETHRHDFHSRMKGGSMDSTVEFHYRDRDCEIHGRAQKITNEWAIELDDAKEGRDLYRQLESELIKNGLGDYNPRVVVIALKLDPVPPTPEVKLSPAERVRNDMKRDAEMLAAYVDERESIDPALDKQFINNRSVKQHLVDIADQRIERIVNPSSVPRLFRQ